MTAPSAPDKPPQRAGAPHGDYFAHPTAVIDQPATIGGGTKIWHFCHVMAGARIGEDCN
ncbi:MAG: oxidoreductase, partial [bacterium]|nr:oxidoreductase [bacterium]